MAAGGPRSSPSGRLVSATVWALLLLVSWLWGRALTEGGPSAAPGSASSAASAAAEGLPPPAAPLPGAAEPRTVEIDGIGVRAEVVPRGVDGGGGVAPPPLARPDLVGWYAGGPTPGAAGAAVLVGHVDTERRPAVFHALAAAEPGSPVRVTRADGRVAEFTVSGVELVERGAFDADRVYGPRRGGAAELRLITCGGTFDAATRSYSANVVVSAYLTGSRDLTGSR
ncbi:class F sortase [Streptomyces sp. MP131-18]|uniref:class F sortase n=1 Tax=Streptomyces sp. MP131-18 TaxID=1857892 RepID=UPI00097C82EA|nr:class F sortase [Streptomyces sp. MP131-18]ONK13995.1 Sortase family protein [Streptomyces sp. MP131-18]